MQKISEDFKKMTTLSKMYVTYAITPEENQREEPLPCKTEHFWNILQCTFKGFKDLFFRC